MDLKYVIVGQEVEILFRGQPCRFQLMQAKDQSGNLYSDVNTLITTVQQTKAIMISAPIEKVDVHTQKMSYSNIGGLEEQIRIVREMVETPLQNPQLFQKYGMFVNLDKLRFTNVIKHVLTPGQTSDRHVVSYSTDRQVPARHSLLEQSPAKQMHM